MSNRTVHSLDRVAAIVLAAGSSSRFGQPKLLMPWKNSTVIGSIISTIQTSGIREIHVITGGSRTAVEKVLTPFLVHLDFNLDFANQSMINSLQVGIRSISPPIKAAMIFLGDQPLVTSYIIRKILKEYLNSTSDLIVPVFQNHKGHPWILGQGHWGEILSMTPEVTLRDFLHRHESNLNYVPVRSAAILRDFDTKSEYRSILSKK